MGSDPQGLTPPVVTKATTSPRKTPSMSEVADGEATGAPETAARQALMRACAEASEEELETALAGLGQLPSYRDLRAPQTGLVMLRGCIGGTGAPFNVGEATVTRAAVQLANGTIGFSYLLG